MPQSSSGDTQATGLTIKVSTLSLQKVDVMLVTDVSD